MNHKQRRKAGAATGTRSAQEATAVFAEALRHHQGGNLAEAERLYRQAIELQPDYVDAHCNRGAALQGLGLLEDAVNSYRRAIALKSDYAAAYNNLAVALQRLGRLDEALASCRRALLLGLATAEVHFNLGAILQDLSQLEEAITHYRVGLSLGEKPGRADIHYNIGAALHRSRRLEEALESFDVAMKINPDIKYLRGDHFYISMYLSDWAGAQGKIARLLNEIENNKIVTTPFALGAWTDRGAALRKAAEIVIRDRHPECLDLPAPPPVAAREKIRVGYFSSDYRIHPVAYAIADILEAHDRTKFEIVAISLAHGADDEIRQRISRAADEFVDVSAKSDRDVAMLSRSMGIDVAVDLNGFTEGGRPGIFSRRAAPIQVNYLGYGGTMGAAYFDYIVADRTLIPDHCRQFYSEKIAYLPNTCLPKNSLHATRHSIADERDGLRERAGLPKDAFVFCCLNNSYKIIPEMFDAWMRILGQIEGSVLWLREESDTISRNLRKEVAARGVAPERLIFAKKVSQEEYLQRYLLADLFLDTWPYTAGSVARECLWAGLPLLTLVGESYVSRMAASLLNVLELPELVASTMEHYEATAIDIARNPGRLKHLKETLDRNRLATPCFDTQLLTRNLENAYTQMYGRYQDSVTPADIFVA